MVLFFTSTALGPDQPVVMQVACRNVTSIADSRNSYMGKDKFENEDLIRYAYPEDVWFHVDKLSSAHVYLRMPTGVTWEAIPEPLLKDCCQLVKANSIEGNKKNNVTMIYTPAANLKRTGDMAIGQVSFYKEKTVRRYYITERENPIVNRLNKTKVERQVDHEADRIIRQQEIGKQRKLEANERKRIEAELAKKRKQEAEARDYNSLFAAQEQYKKEKAAADGYGSETEKKEGDFDSDEDFM